MKKKALLLCAGMVLIAVLMATGNLLIPFCPLSLNDLTAQWLISPRRYFIETPSKNGEKLCLNPELIRLDHKPQCFAPRKAPGTFRIFCLGGSTTEGWPFQHLLSYPDFLNLELKDVLPSRRIKVINAGILSSDSFSDLPLLKELLGCGPDMIIIYEGRNEYLNDPLHFGPRAKLLFLHFWLLRHLSLYRYLRYRIFPTGIFVRAINIMFWAKKGLKPNYGDLVRQHMIENLTSMLRLARRNHCRVMLVTQVMDPSDPSEDWLKSYNDSIRRLAAEQKVPIIDAAHGFESYRGGFGPIFLSHLGHPDVGGYFLMSQTAAHSLARSGLIAPAKDWRWSKEKSEIDYLRKLAVTPRSLADTYAFLPRFYLAIKMPSLARRYTALALKIRRNGWTALPRWQADGRPR